MTDTQNNRLQAGVLPGIKDASFRSDSSAPDGILVENLRRRGIDRMRLSLAPPRKPSLVSRLLGRKTSFRTSVVTETITIADQSILVDLEVQNQKSKKDKKSKGPKPIPFSQVASVEISQGAMPAVVLSHGKNKLIFGAGLGEETLRWLKDRLTLEVAGLVWKPVFHVGRRSTRKVSSAEDDVYAQWQGGSNRLIDSFLEEAPLKATALSAALGNENWAEAKKILHWLKSSCASVGAVQLSDLCQRIEVEIEINDLSRTRVLGASFATEFNKVARTLERIRQPAEGSEQAGDGAEADDHEKSADQPLTGTRILIAEDSKVNLALACDYLEEAGAEVVTAADGREAVDRYMAGSFDLILMDCQMPKMDGFEATRLIRQKEAMLNRMPMPIIALTAQTLRDDRSNCLNAGMSDHLGKPYTHTEIIEIALKWRANRPQSDATPDAEAAPAADAAATDESSETVTPNVAGDAEAKGAADATAPRAERADDATDAVAGPDTPRAVDKTAVDAPIPHNGASDQGAADGDAGDPSVSASSANLNVAEDIRKSA